MKKNLNRLATLALSGMMVMSMTAPAFAATIPYKKVIHTDGHTYAPAATFTFNIVPKAGKVEFEGKEYNVENAAPNNVVTADSVTFVPGEGERNGLGTEDPGRGAHFEKTFNINIDETKLPKPGIYFYEMTENEPEDGEKYEGVRYSKAKFTIMVIRSLDEQGGLKTTYAVERQSAKIGNHNVAASKPGQIENNYGKHYPHPNPNPDPEPNPNFPDPDPNPNKPDPKNNTTHDVIIKKKLDGTMPEYGKEFTFRVTIESQNKKEWFKNAKVVAKIDPQTHKATSYTEEIQAPIKPGETHSFTFTAENGIHIWGLTENDKITVTEVGGDGYEMSAKEVYTIEGKDKDKSYFKELGATGFVTTAKVIEDNAEADIVNKKDAPTPTGIVMNVAPYAMMLAVAGGLGVVFMNRKKEEE